MIPYTIKPVLVSITKKYKTHLATPIGLTPIHSIANPQGKIKNIMTERIYMFEVHILQPALILNLLPNFVNKAKGDTLIYPVKQGKNGP